MFNAKRKRIDNETDELESLTITGVSRFSNGTAGAPSITFSSDTDTGIYRVGANDIGISVGGTKVVGISSTLFDVNVPMEFDELDVAGTTDSSSTSTGSIITAGGVGIAKKLFIGDQINQTSTTDSTSVSTGSIVTAGGVGIAKKLFVGDQINETGTTDSSSVSTGSIVTAGGVGIAKKLFIGDQINQTSTTDSTSVSTGSIVTAGGIGIAKDCYIGSELFLPSSGATASGLSFYATSTFSLETRQANSTSTGFFLGNNTFNFTTTRIGKIVILTWPDIQGNGNFADYIITSGSFPSWAIPTSELRFAILVTDPVKQLGQLTIKTSGVLEISVVDGTFFDTVGSPNEGAYAGSAAYNV